VSSSILIYIEGPAAAIALRSDLICCWSIATLACIWYIDFLPPTLFGVSCRSNFWDVWFGKSGLWHCGVGINLKFQWYFHYTLQVFFSEIVLEKHFRCFFSEIVLEKTPSFLCESFGAAMTEYYFSCLPFCDTLLSSRQFVSQISWLQGHGWKTETSWCVLREMAQTLIVTRACHHGL
jgi:hypothetical protein